MIFSANSGPIPGRIESSLDGAELTSVMKIMVPVASRRNRIAVAIEWKEQVIKKEQTSIIAMDISD
jgi:predicted RNase H-like nuclease